MHRKLFNPHDMDCACSSCSNSMTQPNKYKNSSCNGGCNNGSNSDICKDGYNNYNSKQSSCTTYPKFECRTQTKDLAAHNLEIQKTALINDLSVKCMAHFNNIEVGCNAEINNLNVLEKTNLQCLDVACLAQIRDLIVSCKTELDDLRVNGNTTTHDLNVCNKADFFNICVDNKAILKDLCASGQVKLTGDDICIGNNKTVKTVNSYNSNNRNGTRSKQNMMKDPSKTVIKGDLCVGSCDPKTDFVVKGNTLLECDVVAPGYVCLGTCDGKSISMTDIKGNLDVGKNVKINEDLEVCGDLLIKGEIIQTTDKDICIEGRLLVKDEVCILGDSDTDAILKVDKITTNTGNKELVICADLSVEGDFCTDSFSTDQINCKNDDQILVNCDLCIGSGHILLTDTIMGKAAINPQTTVNNDLIVEGDLCVEQKIQVDEIECKDPGDPNAHIEINCDLCLNGGLSVDTIDAKGEGPIIVSDDLCVEGSVITNSIECKYPCDGLSIECDTCIEGTLEVDAINPKDGGPIIIGDDICVEGAVITNSIECKYPDDGLDIDCDVFITGKISTTETPTVIMDAAPQSLQNDVITPINFSDIRISVGGLDDLPNDRIVLNETNSTYMVTLFANMESGAGFGVFEGIINYIGNGVMSGLQLVIGPPAQDSIRSTVTLVNNPRPSLTITGIIRTSSTLGDEFVTAEAFQNSGNPLNLTDTCLSVTKIA